MLRIIHRSRFFLLRSSPQAESCQSAALGLRVLCSSWSLLSHENNDWPADHRVYLSEMEHGSGPRSTESDFSQVRLFWEEVQARLVRSWQHVHPIVE